MYTASDFEVTVKYLTQPKLKSQITGFAPMRGKIGTRVVITGINLGGTKWVKFGGVKALYTVPTNTKIVAHVPAKAHTGKIRIKTTTGISTKALTFTVLPGGRHLAATWTLTSVPRVAAPAGLVFLSPSGRTGTASSRAARPSRSRRCRCAAGLRAPGSLPSMQRRA